MFTDLGLTHRTELINGVLIQVDAPAPAEVDLTVTLTKPQLLALLGGAIDHRQLATQGDTTALGRILSFLDPPAESFPIVTP